ncbi:MAG: PIN domain-containing protein [Candidatus Aenigmarchaeota archaeon]|nr:PIN domain-containing protein [Candidatus Aenigmarchaeota archaeon]
MNRIKDNEIKAFTSVIVLSEILHKLMISEIVKKYNVGYLEALNYFKNKPNIFLKLEKCWEDIKEIKSINNLVILDVTDKAFDIGIKYSKEFKLLISDALHLAVMKEYNITNLASNDSDFERVGWINLFKPKEEQ